MKALRKAADELAKADLAPNTRKALEHDWKLFSTWCSEAGQDGLPATFDTIRCYIVAMEERGLSPSTMARRVSTISTYHQKAKLPNPIGREVQALISNVRRKKHRVGNKSRAKKSISGEELRKISSKLEAEGTNLAIRDRALLVFGFNSAMRRSEISELDLCDVEIESNKLITVTIKSSKTDQESQGSQIGLFPGRHRESCPFRTLKAWLKIRGKWDGPLFCRVEPRKLTVMRERLGPTSINEAVKRCVKLIGLDGEKYGGHTLRASCVTSATQTGKSVLSIMTLTRHKTVQTLARYNRSNNIHACNVLDKVC